MVSVPNASYFRGVQARDTVENAVELFGEPIYPGEALTFRDYGLLTWNHVQVFTEDSLWSVLRGVGFQNEKIRRFDIDRTPENKDEEFMATALNRIPFSLVMCSTK